jgi:hypothetical protein
MTTTVAGWDGDPVLQVLHGRMMVRAMPWQRSVAQRRRALIAVASQHACVVQKPEYSQVSMRTPYNLQSFAPQPDKTLLTSPTRADLSLAGRSDKEPVDHRLHKGACLPCSPKHLLTDRAQQTLDLRCIRVHAVLL